jgi:hypothetical protein
MRSLYIGSLVIFVATSAHAFGIDDSSYVNRKLGVRLEIPEGWALHQQTGFPSVLALLIHRDNHRVSISLTVGVLPAPGKPNSAPARGTSGDAARSMLESYVRSNRRGMAAIGLKVEDSRRVSIAERSTWRLTLRDDKGGLRLLQHYLTRGQEVFILTLTAPADQLTRYTQDLFQALDLLRLKAVQTTLPRAQELVSYPTTSPTLTAPPPPPPGGEPSTVTSKPNRGPTTLPVLAPESAPVGASSSQPTLEEGGELAPLPEQESPD